MKIRTGFVSNSSSSSFLCDFCGNEYSGWDARMEDAGMILCENGHTICESHLIEIVKDKAFTITKMNINDVSFENINEYIEGEEITEITDDNYERSLDAINIYLDDGCGENKVLPEQCPLCAFNGITDSDLTKSLLKLTEQTREEYVEAIKTKFKTYKEFLNFING